MKKKIMRRLLDGIFPNRVQKIARQLSQRLEDVACITNVSVLDSKYFGLPYSISKCIFRHATPNITSYESNLEGLTLPVYKNFNVNNFVQNIAKNLIYSACGIGISCPELPVIRIPANEPRSFDIFFNQQRRKQTPGIRGNEGEGMTELTERSEIIYKFYLEYRERFDKALRMIDEDYPHEISEWNSLIESIVEKTGMNFIKLQRRQRVSSLSATEMGEVMKRAYGSAYLPKKD